MKMYYVSLVASAKSMKRSLNRQIAHVRERCRNFWAARTQATEIIAVAWSKSESPLAPGSAAAIAAVAVLHAIFLIFIFWGLHLSEVTPASRELHVVIYSPQSVPPPFPEIAVPEIQVMQPPDIVIADDAATITALAAPPSSVLAPRPDPAHPNPLPGATAFGAANVAQATPLLRLTISSDGSVAQVSIVRSSGQHDVDLAIASFVKEKWRFLPALLNGTAIEYA